LSITQLDKLWGQYYTDLRQRKQGDACKELHIATRWSVHDVIGRLQEQYENDPSARFLAFPALDANDESNFDYPYGLGFSTEFYHKQRDIMDDASWKALYMNEPIEREGLLYDEDELQYYMQLPEGDPDSVIAVCDTKDKGSDFCAMPIFYQYGDKFFLEDLIYDDGLPERIDPRIVSRLIKNKVKLCQFESNAGGGRVAQDIDKDMRAKGGTTTITTKFTTQNKGTKIFVNAGYCKENIIFKDPSKQDKEYRSFMSALCSYTHIGKNAHDDAPDSLAMFADLVQGIAGTRVEVRRRWF
jgi:predicted phage terminase large subunit-like protein